jgi:hypothetical protein
MMRMYRLRIIEHRSYNRQSAKRAHQRPKRPKNVPDILSLLLSVAQKTRYWGGQPVERRRWKDPVEIAIDIKIPASHVHHVDDLRFTAWLEGRTPIYRNIRPSGSPQATVLKHTRARHPEL